MTKYIFVTGGVVSGLGKGITAASLGRLLKARGLKVAAQKLDPYINVDPGTMSPDQHGEVYVTEDGAETDLDLGHYERFIDEDLNKFSNLTTGKVYWNCLLYTSGHTVMTTEEALAAAHDLGYPVLMRPSYVLGGQNMIIAYGDEDINEYMAIILRQKQDNPVLIDKYLSGTEIEVDAICDGENILIPGIMEHVERTGIHSGDSIAVYPAKDIDDELSAKIVKTTEMLCTELKACLLYTSLDAPPYRRRLSLQWSETNSFPEGLRSFG